MPSFLVCLEVHPLPESPPTGDMERRVVFLFRDGGTLDYPARAWSTWTWDDAPIAWSERPVLPAPGDRLTTKDVRYILDDLAYADEDSEAHNVAARLRAAVRLDSHKHITPDNDENVVDP
jgi:hypothetical protein